MKKVSDVRTNINNGYYEPSNPPTRPDKPYLPMKHTASEARAYALQLEDYENKFKVYSTEIVEYRRLRNCHENEFKADVLKDCGLTNHRAADRAFQMAKDRGSSLLEILDELEELTVLIDICTE